MCMYVYININKGMEMKASAWRTNDDENVYKLRKGILFFVKAIKIVYDYHNLI